MKTFILLLIALVAGSHLLYAQREADNWYFGFGAGISFSNGAPVALAGGQLNQSEGVSSISDANGKLLFYTDGATIWNRNHTVMQNGTGLNGDGISAQSGVIVPMPNNADIYYVFTVSNWTNLGSPYGLYYSIVDMRLASGAGAVTTKNALLSSSPREQVTSAVHANCRDIWIVSHEKGNANFLAYLLTPAGIQLTPVISTVGMLYNGGNRYGYLRFASDGRKLCSTLGYAITGASTLETVQLYDFDKSTGIVSNAVTLATVNTCRDAYSSEFSTDNTKLYVVAFNGNFIYQYNLSAGSAAAIIASQVNVATGFEIKSCLQMGPDKKIYVSKNGQSYLGAILNPNQPGTLCNYLNNAVSLNGKTGALGLPNFMQSFFSLPYLGVDSSICTGASLVLNAYTNPGETYLWQDGSVNPTFTVTQAGQYWVDVTNNGCVKRDEIMINLTPLPVVNLGPDSAICGTATILLDATTGTGASYLWQDGTTLPTYTVNSAGNYSVTVTAKGCSASDAITVNSIAPPPVNLGHDTTICTGTTLLLDAFNAAINKYKWQDASTGSSIVVSLSGQYWVAVSNAGCTVSDTIKVSSQPAPLVDLGKDTIICSNAVLTLDASSAGSGATYTWQDGTSTTSYSVTVAGDYWVKVTDNGCSKADTIAVTVVSQPVVNLGKDTAICTGTTLLLDASAAGNNNYSWLNGNVTPTLTVSIPGKYWVEVSNAACITHDTIEINNKPLPVVELGNDTLLCSNAVITLEAGTPQPLRLYLWQDGATGNSYPVTQPGTYWVQVTEGGCSRNDTIQVKALPVAILDSDTTLCLGQTIVLKAVVIPNATYTWQDGSTQPAYVAGGAGSYKVDVQTTCGILSDMIVVKGEDCRCRVHFPNVFSPDQNHHNDIFKPVIQQCNFTEYKLQVFTRWGERIFESNHPATGWDGSYKGQLCDVGTYVYMVVYRTGNNTEKKVNHGTLLLVR